METVQHSDGKRVFDTDSTNGVWSDIYNPECPARHALDRIADKWTVLIIGTLADESARFTELRAALPGITPKVLTQNLRKLERDGLVSRHVFPEIPPRVEYSLTALGRSLEEPFAAIRDWAHRNITEISHAQDRYDHSQRQ